MTAILSPASHAQTYSDLGFAYVFAAEAIRQEITEQLNVLAEGLVQLVGDLMGSGSDTLRITRYGGVGYAERMTTMASETDPIVATGFTSGYDTVTIARHGLAKEETYTDQILQRSGVNLEMLQEKVPDSWLSTLRYKLAVAGAGVAGSVSATGRAWTFDDELALLTAAHETEGFRGSLISVRHAEQLSDLRASLRDEPAYQFPEEANKFQGLKPGGGSFDFLGIRNIASFDVQASGGDHVGFAYVPGAAAWAVASTTPVKVANPAMAMFIPELGMVIEQKSEGNQATGRFDANAFFGLAFLDPSLFPSWRLLSVND